MLVPNRVIFNDEKRNGSVVLVKFLKFGGSKQQKFLGFRVLVVGR